MNKKIIFFDVDGTLVDVRPAREYVPESTIKAVRETRKKGNLCFLCTGRSLAEIYPHILDIGFDGIIGAGGGFVTIGDEMLYQKKYLTKMYIVSLISLKKMIMTTILKVMVDYLLVKI